MSQKRVENEGVHDRLYKISKEKKEEKHMESTNSEINQ